MQISTFAPMMIRLVFLLIAQNAWAFDYSTLDYHGPYFILHSGDPLVSERLDPIMAAGSNPSNHVHHIYGANTFGPNFDYDAAQKSTCNTHGVKIDHSNYWYPALYFHDKAKNTYTMVKTDFTTYYHYDLVNGKPRQAFPKGFKMISGNAMLRHNDSATNIVTSSIKWMCHGSNPDVSSIGGFGDHVGYSSCPQWPGLSSEIWFPFCHNGQTFDAANPMAHVSFGQNNDGTPTHQGGSCPSSHPTVLPQIFAEFHHDTSAFKWSADDNPWVLAQGDPTGSAMHADFANGWEDGLQDAINLDPTDPTKTKCHVGESKDGLSSCFEMLDQNTISNCKINSVVQGDGDVSSPGSSLPGCNPLQSGPNDATVQTNCAGYQPASSVAGGSPVQTAAGSSTAVSYAASQSSSAGGNSGAGNGNSNSPASGNSSPSSTSGSSSPASPGNSAIPSSVTVNGETWTYQGCYSDLVPDRSIRTLGRWGSGATASDCAASCKGSGLKIAGVEFGNQCFCDNSMRQTKKLDDSACNMACPQGGQMCGGAGGLQVYAASGTNLGLSKRDTRHAAHIKKHIRDFTGI